MIEPAGAELPAEMSRIMEIVASYHIPGRRIMPFVVRHAPTYVPTVMGLGFFLLMVWLVAGPE